MSHMHKESMNILENKVRLLIMKPRKYAILDFCKMKTSYHSFIHCFNSDLFTVFSSLNFFD